MALALGAGWDISPTYLVLGILTLIWAILRLRPTTPTPAKVPADPTTTPRREFRPFKPIYHITLAIRSASPAELITIDEDYLKRIEHRRELIEKLGPGVHGVVEGGEKPTRELYSYIINNVLENYPTVFTRRDGRVHNSITGRSVPFAPAGDPTTLLKYLAETVEEDLFILVREGDTHRCVAFECCFPSGFDPASKLGLGLSGIHAPVPSYDRIGPSMERFFTRMEAGKPHCRVNWSVQTHAELHDCDRNHGKGDQVVSEGVNIDTTFLRCELQTLTRLPETGALLFSFKTYLYPVKQLKEEGLGEEFATAIEGLSKGNAPGMWQYKAAVRWGPAVCEYLRS